jgi:hypothetical protein
MFISMNTKVDSWSCKTKHDFFLCHIFLKRKIFLKNIFQKVLLQKLFRFIMYVSFTFVTSQKLRPRLHHEFSPRVAVLGRAP